MTCNMCLPRHHSRVLRIANTGCLYSCPLCIYSFIRCLSLLFDWVMLFCLSLRQTVIYALVLVALKLCYGLLAFLCHFFSFCTCLFDCRSLICLSSCLFCLFNCLSFNVVSVCLTLFVCLKFLHWKLQQASW